MNYLLIYNKTTKRVEYFCTYAYGIPVLPDYYPDYDSVSQNYVVGLTVYDPSIWESDGTLTAAAISAYGIAIDEASKYLMDVDFDSLLSVADVTDYILNDDLDDVVLSAPPISAQPRYLGIEILYGAMGEAGTGPRGLDRIPSDAARYEYGGPGSAGAVGGYPISVRVTKYLADGTVDTTATDIITLIPDKGVFTFGTAAMVAGVADFTWSPGVESGLITFEASSSTLNVTPGVASIWVDHDDSLLDGGADSYRGRAYVGEHSIYVPGALDPAMGPLGDGTVYVLTLPEETGRSVAYGTPIRLARARLSCMTPPTGGPLTVRIQGQTSLATVTLNLADGVWTSASETGSWVTSESFTPGEDVHIKVTAGNSAAELNIYLRWENLRPNDSA